jgi:homoserine kinase
MNRSFSIQVPASTANLGPGFDSVGLALNLYLTLEVVPSETWSFTASSPELRGLPVDQSHFIYQVVSKVENLFHVKVEPCSVAMESDIPLARGLGSSAAAIVAGIELANHLAGLELSKNEKLQIATLLEGHPDNVGASLYGGLVVGSYLNNEVELISFTKIPMEAVAFIPKTTLLTKDSRGVLPENLPFGAAVAASSLANLLVASLLKGDLPTAGKMMEKDLLHQPYRKTLLPHYEEFEKVAKENGAFGVALSGAGPTVLAFIEQGKGAALEHRLKGYFTKEHIRLLKIDDKGSVISIKKSDSV